MLCRLDCTGPPAAGWPPESWSNEGLMKGLKESRKRDVVEDGDGSFTAEQLGKRRCLHLFFRVLFCGYSVLFIYKGE